MNDRELLDLAAKAVGYRVVGSIVNPDGDVIALTCKLPGQNLPRFRFGPLLDDGDALRLAVHLGLKIEHHDDSVVVWDDYIGTGFIPYNGDACKATRRAIVQSASEHDRAAAQGAGGQP